MKTCRLLLLVLISLIPVKSKATAILKVQDVEFTSSVELFITNIVNGELSTLYDPTAIFIPNGTQTPPTNAFVLNHFENGQFATQSLISDFSTGFFTPDQPAVVTNAKLYAELNMQFTVDGEGATIGGFGHVDGGNGGAVSFSLIDNFTNTHYNLPEPIFLNDGHSYSLSLISITDTSSSDLNTYFDWDYNSNFIVEVPEPSSALFFGTGFAIFLGATRRKKHNN